MAKKKARSKDKPDHGDSTKSLHKQMRRKGRDGQDLSKGKSPKARSVLRRASRRVLDHLPMRSEAQLDGGRAGQAATEGASACRGQEASPPTRSKKPATTGQEARHDRQEARHDRQAGGCQEARRPDQARWPRSRQPTQASPPRPPSRRPRSQPPRPPRSRRPSRLPSQP